MSEHDGIREREEGRSRMPVGMTVLFMGLIVFGLIYLYRYLPATTGWNQAAQYERKVKTREAAVTGAPAEALHPETEHQQMVSAELGKEIYRDECAVCHGKDLAGGIGPSLLGPKFRFGGTIEDHARIIAKGTSGGMPAFGLLGDAKIRSVAAFIHTMARH